MHGVVQRVGKVVLPTATPSLSYDSRLHFLSSLLNNLINVTPGVRFKSFSWSLNNLVKVTPGLRFKSLSFPPFF